MITYICKYYLPVLLVKAYGMISLSPGPRNIYQCVLQDSWTKQNIVLTNISDSLIAQSHVVNI